MTLHPFFQAATERAAPLPALSDGTPVAAREMVALGRGSLGEGPDLASVRDLTIPTRAGSVAARLLVPHGEAHGLVVYLHGGGWVVGELDDYDALGRSLAAASGCAVLLPDYRLAPEHPFPDGLEDVEDALLWAWEQRGTLAAGTSALVVAGDSAGANLVTVACRRLGPRVEPALQVLVYPVTDSDFDTESYLAAGQGLPLTRADMQWFFGHYVPAERWSHPDVAPSRAPDLDRLPRTVIVTAEHDVLRSDGVRYAERLRQAGVAVAHTTYPGMVHGFLRHHNNVDVSRGALDDVAAAVGAAVRGRQP